MANLLIQRPFIPPPGRIPRINYRHPLVDGSLRFLMLGGVEVVDLLNGRVAANTLTFHHTPHGIATTSPLDTLADAISPANSTALNFTTQNFTILVYMYVQSVGTGTTEYADVFGRYLYNSEGSNAGWLLQKGPTSHGTNGTPAMRFNAFSNNGSANYQLQDSVFSMAAGDIYTYAVVFDATTNTNSTLYRNGRDVRSGVAIFSASVGSQSTNGVRFSSYTTPTKILPLTAVVWERKLSQGEIQEASNRPFGFFTFPSRFTVSGGPATEVTRSASDAISLSDASAAETVIYVEPLTLAAADALSLIEGFRTQYIIEEMSRDFSERILFTDGFVAAVPRLVLASDTLAFSDELVRLLAASIEAYDTLQYLWADDINYVVTLMQGIDISDTLALSDAISTLLVNIGLTAAVGDVITLLDALTLQGVNGKRVTDRLVLVDYILVALLAKYNFGDAITLLDTIQLMHPTSASPAESDTMSVVDEISVGLYGHELRTAADSFALTDAVTIRTTLGDTAYLRRYLNDL